VTGKTLGHCEILEPFGADCMGEVFTELREEPVVTARVLISCLCGFYLAISILACGGGRSGPEQTTDRVKVAVLPFFSIVPFHIAAEEGYFAEQNLDVEFIRLGRDQEIMTSLARGEVDVASGMVTLNELNLAATGVRIRMIASLSSLASEHCAFAAVLAHREHLESGALQDREQIRRLRFDVNVLMPHGYWLDELLLPLDLTTDDLDLVELPPPASIQAIVNGSIDVTVLSEPFVSLPMESEEVVVWERVGRIAPEYPFSVVKYGPTILDERPEVGERFAVAMLKAVRQFNLGKTARKL
jgi:NitT/TauT family transport system substrate-binding protein